MRVDSSSLSTFVRETLPVVFPYSKSPQPLVADNNSCFTPVTWPPSAEAACLCFMQHQLGWLRRGQKGSMAHCHGGQVDAHCALGAQLSCPPWAAQSTSWPGPKRTRPWKSRRIIPVVTRLPGLGRKKHSLSAATSPAGTIVRDPLTERARGMGDIAVVVFGESFATRTSDVTK